MQTTALQDKGENYTFIFLPKDSRTLVHYLICLEIIVSIILLLIHYYYVCLWRSDA